jgi:hypothetical protein
LSFCDGDKNTHNNTRVDKEIVKKGGIRKAFYVGGNSTCRSHIRQHYELYQRLCKEKGIPENHYAIPRAIWKEMERKKNNPKEKTQGKLDGLIERVQGPREFTRESALQAVTKFIACDDQVSY